MEQRTNKVGRREYHSPSFLSPLPFHLPTTSSIFLPPLLLHLSTTLYINIILPFPSSFFIFVSSYSHLLTINLSLSLLFYAQYSLIKKNSSLSLPPSLPPSLPLSLSLSLSLSLKFLVDFFIFLASLLQVDNFLYSLKLYFGLMQFSFVF